MFDRLRILHFEITQGLQDHLNSIRLVRDKPTVIRVIPAIDHGPPIHGVSAVLKAFDAADKQLAPNAGLQPDNGSITVSEFAARADPTCSLDFTLEPAWYSLAAVRFEVQLTLPQQVPNPLPGLSYHAEFVTCRPFRVRYLKVAGFRPDGGSVAPRLGVSMQRACNFVRAAWPVDPSQVSYESEGSTAVALTYHGNELRLNPADLLSLLSLQYLLASPETDALYGWVSADCLPFNGLSDPIYFGGLGRVAFGTDEGADDINRTYPATWRYRRTMAHELGHNTHQVGEVASLNSPECVDGLDHPPIYPSSQRYYPRQLQDDELGYDTLGIDPEQNLLSRTVVCAGLCFIDHHIDHQNPIRQYARMFDVMEAGRVEVDAWIGPYNYRKLLRCFAAPGGKAVNGGPQKAPTEYTVIQGVIRLDGSASLTRALPLLVTNANRERIAAVAEATDAATLGEAELTVTLKPKNGDGVEKQITIRWNPRFEDVEGNPSDAWYTWAVDTSAHRFDSGELLFRGAQAGEAVPPANQDSFVIDANSLTASSGAESVQVDWTFDYVGQNSAPAAFVHVFRHSIDDQTWEPDPIWTAVKVRTDSHTEQIPLSKFPNGVASFLQITIHGGPGEVKTSPPIHVQDDGEGGEGDGPKANPRILCPEPNRQFTAGKPILLAGYALTFDGQAVEPTWFVRNIDQNGNDIEVGKANKVVLRDLTTPANYRITLDVPGAGGSPDSVDIEILP